MSNTQEVNYVIDTLQLELEEQLAQEAKMKAIINEIESQKKQEETEKKPLKLKLQMPTKLPERTTFVNRHRINLVPRIGVARIANNVMLATGSLNAAAAATQLNTATNTCLYDTITIQLPNWFSQSANSEKSVELEYIHLYQIDPTNGVWYSVPSTMHSDLVQFYKSADNYVCSTNMMYSFPKKFVIGDKKDTFDMWFRDMAGYLIDLDTTKTRVILELVLRY